MNAFKQRHKTVCARFYLHALRGCAAAVLWMVHSWVMAQSVVFINPGKTDEAYWVAAAQSMQQAARSLGMQLQVIYTERDRLRPRLCENTALAVAQT